VVAFFLSHQVHQGAIFKKKTIYQITSMLGKETTCLRCHWAMSIEMQVGEHTTSPAAGQSQVPGPVAFV